MKKLLPLILTSVAAPSASAALIITGAFDGPLAGGEPKVVELYADTDIADLSQYGVGAANNGGGTDGVELILSGSASAGDFIYILQDGTGTGFLDYFGFTPAAVFDGSFANGGAASINGDDAIEIFNDPTGAFAGAETIVDTFGDISTDGTGQAWEYLDGWAYRADGTGPDGGTFEIGNWSFSGTNVNDGTTSNATNPTPFPIGTYAVPEPSSALLGGIALLGLLRRRR